jgi:adenine phosphoribosyltransferase
MDLTSALRHIPDFPKAGIDFIDITTVLKDSELFRETIDQMAAMVKDLDFDMIIGSESRGFILGAPLAYATGKGFAPVRKQGKLPYQTVQATYSLEYGNDTLEMHIDAIQPGQKVLVVDDLLATGGTALANCQMIEALGGSVAKVIFFIELEALGGRQKLAKYPVEALVKIKPDI